MRATPIFDQLLDQREDPSAAAPRSGGSHRRGDRTVVDLIRGSSREAPQAPRDAGDEAGGGLNVLTFAAPGDRP